MTNPNPQGDELKRIERWFIGPVETLRQHMANSDEGFIAMMVGLVLLERMVNVGWKTGDVPKENLQNESRPYVGYGMAHLIGTTRDAGQALYGLFRNGILHQGFPKEEHGTLNIGGWRFSAGFGPKPLVNNDILEICPIQFFDLVRDLARTRPELLSHPAVPEGPSVHLPTASKLTIQGVTSDQLPEANRSYKDHAVTGEKPPPEETDE